MTHHIIRGNALALPLADASVDLVCTSPPYFGLRSYSDGGEHYAGQLGSEATPAEFVAALLAATREMVRVLKPSGSIFVNLGDKYAARRRPELDRATLHDAARTAAAGRRQTGRPRAKPGQSRTKSLIGHPVAVRPRLHRRPRPDPPRRNHLVEAERAARVCARTGCGAVTSSGFTYVGSRATSRPSTRSGRATHPRASQRMHVAGCGRR